MRRSKQWFNSRLLFNDLELVEIRRPVLAHLQSEVLGGVRATALTSFTSHALNQSYTIFMIKTV